MGKEKKRLKRNEMIGERNEENGRKERKSRNGQRKEDVKR